MLFSSNRGIKGSVNRPPIPIYSCMENSIINSYGFRPFYLVANNTFICIRFITSSVIRLFLTCGPFTIVCRIITCIVNAIDREVAVRSASHIFKERSERVYPFVTNSYSPTPVSKKTFFMFIITSAFHSLPYFVFRRAFHTVIFPMQASTRFCVPGCKVACGNNFWVTTATDTFPQCPTFFNYSFFNNGEFPKGFPGKVDKFTHFNLQVKIASILRCVESKLLEFLQFGGYPIHTNNHIGAV